MASQKKILFRTILTYVTRQKDINTEVLTNRRILTYAGHV